MLHKNTQLLQPDLVLLSDNSPDFHSSIKDTGHQLPVSFLRNAYMTIRYLS
jgi:hypothetical protein